MLQNIVLVRARLKNIVYICSVILLIMLVMKKRCYFFIGICCMFFSCIQQELETDVFDGDRDKKSLSEVPMQPGAYESYKQVMDVLCGQTRSDVDNPVYPDYYGGAYVNDDGSLVVLITEAALTTRASQEMQTLMNEENVLFSECKNSYNSLLQMVDSVRLLVEEEALSAINIGMFGIDVIKNKVIVYLYDDSESKIKEFVNDLDSELIVFGRCTPIEKHALAMPCGIAVFGRGVGSIGYRAIDSNGRKGFVSAGHCYDVGDSVYYSPEQNAEHAELVGECKYSASFDGYIDASFCEINNPIYEPSNVLPYVGWGSTIGGGNNALKAYTLSTELAQPPTGLTINTIGATSRLRSGTVLVESIHVIQGGRYILSDVIASDYSSEGGDSGGIVYAYQSSNNTRYTVGINIGRTHLVVDGILRPVTICVKAYMINRRFGLTRY